MPAYAAMQSWKGYRRLLEARFGLRIGAEASESMEVIGGHRVHLDTWRPSGTPRGVAVLVHGGGGNGRILAPLGQMAVDAGWMAIAPDLPGYGLTVPRPGWDHDYADWPAIVTEIINAQSGPVVVLGLSLGGLTGLYAAQDAVRIDGVIVTSLLDMSDPDVFAGAARTPGLGRMAMWLIRHAPWVLDQVRLPLALAAPMRAMSSEPGMQRYFSSDPLLGGRWVSMALFRSLHGFRRESLDLPCPLLLVHPGNDAWTSPELSLRSFARIGSQKRLIMLPGGSHAPFEPQAREALRSAILEFLAPLGEAASS